MSIADQILVVRHAGGRKMIEPADLNGRRLTMTNDEAYDFVIAVASGALVDVTDIAQGLENGSEAT